METPETQGKPESDAALAPAPGYAPGWASETIRIINDLTPDIKGKGLSPDWFLLRQRLQEAERIMDEKNVDTERQRDQLATNCRWLIAQMDRIHAALCPSMMGTWQDRVNQAVEAAEKAHNDRGERRG